MGYQHPLPSTANYYTSAPISTPTYDGTGEAIEPSVIFVPAGWNGYRWWMGLSPYTEPPGAGVATENPSILASNDGLNWTAPAANPITAYPGGGAAGNHADARIVFSTDMTTLYLHYQVESATDGTNGFYVKSSTTGTSWSAATKIYLPTGSWNEPTLLYDGTQWRLYWCNGSTGLFFVTASSPTSTTWSAPTTITVPANTWHYDIKREPSGRYVLSYYEQDAAGGKVWLASSWDGVNFTYNSRPTLLGGQVATWPTKLYRPSLTQIGRGIYALYYGGHDASGRCHFGYCTVPSTEIP